MRTAHGASFRLDQRYKMVLPSRIVTSGEAHTVRGREARLTDPAKSVEAP